MKYTLKHENIENDYVHNSVEMIFNEVGLEEILQYMEQFLQACGFCIKGKLEIIEEE